jgi:hypothetical protein
VCFELSLHRYSKTALGRGSGLQELLASPPVQPNPSAGRIILHISKELAVSFSWVQEVVSAALGLHEWTTLKADENAAIIYVLKAALVIPPANDFPCNSPMLDFLINYRSKEGDWVSGKSWRARRV